jgi:cellulose synthase/poly-beta-1,6-N-acetylglucosamine synthase-like glycosyltransferase
MGAALIRVIRGEQNERLRRTGAESRAAVLPDTVAPAGASTVAPAGEKPWKMPWHWALNENVRRVSGVGLAALMASMLLLSTIDRRRHRPLGVRPPMTVLIPCYNDGNSIAATLASVFATGAPALLEVIVINDASKDDSAAQLKRLQERYPFRVITNPENRGKSPSLNDAAKEARHEIILCLDSDTELNGKAVEDMLARITCGRHVGAVSCPYRPSNRGILPGMQAIEYNMLLLTQGAHNLTSAMALWGGCLMVRREAFFAAGCFSRDAITEDVDLAFKMNRAKWRVEQSFVAVDSVVPQSLRAWVRQKLRWTAGGMQCYVRHIPVWLRNPSQIFFILAYSLLILSSIPAVISDLRFGGNVMDLFTVLNRFNTIRVSVVEVFAFYGRDLLRRMLGSGLCCLLSTVYILPLIRRPRDLWKLLLVFPFSLVYFPAYIVVSLFGIVAGLRSLRHLLPSDIKGW